MSRSLSQEAILMRARVDKLEHVTKLNVWGNELEDVAIVGAMPNLQVLALSVNKIATLKDFQYCFSLKELYLRKNLISDLGELRYLQQLPELQVLWLLENPCAELPNYRLRIIKALPNLTKLDDNEVTADERNRADSCRDELGGPKDQRRPPPQAQPPREVQPVRQEPSRPPPSQTPREPPVKRDVQPIAVERAPARRHSVNESPTQQESAFDGRQTEVPKEASENVLCAVMALIQDLDAKGLTLVRRECDRKLRTCS
jgi:hypothetical protein